MTTHTTTTPSRLPGAPPGTATRRPSTAGYWVGALVAVLATVGALVWGAFTFLGWQSQIEDFSRLTPPGTVLVSVTDTGTHYVYLEHDRSMPVPTAPAATVTGPSGSSVPVTAYVGEMRYDVPGVAGQIGDAVLTFPADDPGTYRVTVAQTEAGTTVAVGDDLLWNWAPEVVGIVVLFLGGLLAGLGIVLVTAVRRSGPAR